MAKRNYLQETLVVLINKGNFELIEILRDMEKNYNLDPTPSFMFEVAQESFKDTPVS